MNALPTWLHDDWLFGNSPIEVAIALCAALLAHLLMTLGLRIALKRISAWATRSGSTAAASMAEVLSGTNRSLMALASLLIGLGLLDLPDRWAGRVSQLWFIALALQVALWFNRLIGIGLRRHIDRHTTAGTAQVSAAATLMSWGARTLLWTIVLLAVLSNLGVNITAFVASLGVGGIAVALAAQNILGDLFASLSIAIDKPFEVGDFIVLGDVSGTVENVGVKTTRIRSLGGEQVVMSNTELLKQTISNYKRLQHRRIVFGFGVAYETPAEAMAEIPEIVKGIVSASERLRFDRAHFKALGESSLDVEVVYIVLDADYTVYMDEQQRINLALMQQLATRHVGFAFPSRTVYIVPPPSTDGASSHAPSQAASRTPSHAPAVGPEAPA